MEEMNIGLCGLNFSSKNLGCSALTYSFLNILFEAAEKAEKRLNITFYGSVHSSLRGIPSLTHPNVTMKNFNFNKYKILEFFQTVGKEDVVFDFTGGDSFSDIYGLNRLVKGSFRKCMALWNRKPLVLGPQTYGPYKSLPARFLAKYVISHAFSVYARDRMSQNRALKLCPRKNVELVTDVAFLLPFQKERYSKIFNEHNKTRIGLNFSGLLYSGGYNGGNQFGLSVDYQEYCEKLVSRLLEKGNYEIWLIPHATSDRVGFSDNDNIVCSAIAKKYPEIKVASEFSDPMDAKSFISNMDVFTGARMHATIGAFSSGVVTIPFSYSVKFDGLYGELDYPYYIHGKDYTTDEAVEKTLEYIENSQTLKAAQLQAVKKAEEKLESFKADIQRMIQEM